MDKYFIIFICYSYLNCKLIERPKKVKRAWEYANVEQRIEQSLPSSKVRSLNPAISASLLGKLFIVNCIQEPKIKVKQVDNCPLSVKHLRLTNQ